MSLKSIITESYQIMKDELNKSKKLTNKQLESFKNIYGVSEIDGDVYINRFNLVLTSSIDYDNLKYVIKDLVIEYSIPEYGIYLFVFRKLNDPMLEEAFK